MSGTRPYNRRTEAAQPGITVHVDDAVDLRWIAPPAPRCEAEQSTPARWRSSNTATGWSMGDRPVTQIRTHSRRLRLPELRPSTILPAAGTPARRAAHQTVGPEFRLDRGPLGQIHAFRGAPPGAGRGVRGCGSSRSAKQPWQNKVVTRRPGQSQVDSRTSLRCASRRDRRPLLEVGALSLLAHDDVSFEDAGVPGQGQAGDDGVAVPSMAAARAWRLGAEMRTGRVSGASGRTVARYAHSTIYRPDICGPDVDARMFRRGSRRSS